MSSLNSVAITGRLTRDPELRTTATGKSVVSFSVAVQKRFKPKEESEPDAHFFRVTAWQQTAEFVSNYAQKGRMVGVSGRLEQRRYTGTDGVEREVVEIVADNVCLLDRPRDDSGGGKQPAKAAVSASAKDVEPDDYDPFAEE